MPLINTLWSPYLPLEVEWQGDGDDCREVWKSVCCLCSVVCLKSTRIPASLPIFVQWYVVRPYYVLWYLFYGLILTCKWVNTLKGSFAESKLRDCGLNSLIHPSHPHFHNHYECAPDMHCRWADMSHGRRGRATGWPLPYIRNISITCDFSLILCHKFCMFLNCIFQE